MKHKYIVTGATGKIGSELIKTIGGGMCIGISKHKTANNLLKIDLSTWKGDINHNFSEYDTVIHLAAKAHIDNCEKDRVLSENGATWLDNVVATNNIVEFCKKTNKRLIFISSECVFDGNKNTYSEQDKPNPINWYGKTKHESEKLVGTYKNSIILRTVMAYGGTSVFPDIVWNFAKKLSGADKITAATDQIVSFTFIDDIILAILKSSEQNLKGVYHFAGPDKLSVYDLGIKICKLLGKDINNVVPATMEDILGRKRAILRPKNSVLNSAKFVKRTGFSGTNIDEGLQNVLTAWKLL